MKLGYLDYSELNQSFLEILEKKHREVISSIVACCGNERYYRKLLNESLWRYDIMILEDLSIFFGLQEMYDFASYIQKAIQIKTLQTAKSFIGVL